MANLAFRSIISSITLIVLLNACAGSGPGLNLPPEAPVPQPQSVPVRLEDYGRSGHSTVAVRSYVQRMGNHLGLSEKDQLVIERNSPDSSGVDHIRIKQTYADIPVWGASLVLHRSPEQFLFTNGNVVAGMDQAVDFSTTPKIESSLAIEIAKRDFAGDELQNLITRKESAELVLYPQGTEVALAWHVKFATDRMEGATPARWSYFVGAEDGKILRKFNRLLTAEASGPGGNSVYTHTWTNALDVEAVSGTGYMMDTAKFKTFDFNGSTTTGNIVTGTLSNIGTQSTNGAHGYAEVTVDMLSVWFGFNSIDNLGKKIVSWVDYDVGYANAYWDDDDMMMVYGDGGNIFYPLSTGLDVIAHEIAHGFTQFHSDLIYDGESGGMNESFSDIAGTSAEYRFREMGFLTDRADFDIGEDIVKPAFGDSALRFMCDPTRDQVSIAYLPDFTIDTDVHWSSGIMNLAFCQAVKRFASSTGEANGTPTPEFVKRVAHAFFKANASYWAASSTFLQGAQGTIDAAKSLGFTESEITRLTKAWEDVKIFLPSGSFRIDVSPYNAYLTTWDYVSFAVPITRKAGFSDAVSLSITGVPAGSYAAFSADSTTSNSTNLTISSNSTLTGSHTYASLRGVSGSSTADGALKVMVLPRLTNGTSQGSVSASRGTWKYYVVSIPPSTPSLAVNISGGSGNADLYVLAGGFPTLDYRDSQNQIVAGQYDCKSVASTNTGSCNISSPSAGDWIIGVYSASSTTDVSGLSVKATWSTSYPSPASLTFASNIGATATQATGTVKLSGTAPSGGVKVYLYSADSALKVPQNVTVPAGATEVNFTVTGSNVSEAKSVKIGAFFYGLGVESSIGVEASNGRSIASEDSSEGREKAKITGLGGCATVHGEVRTEGLISWLLPYSMLFILFVQIFATRMVRVTSSSYRRAWARRALRRISIRSGRAHRRSDR